MQASETSPPTTSKSVPGPCLILIAESVTQPLRLMSPGVAGSVWPGVSVGMGTSARVEVGAVKVFRKLKTRSRRTVMVPNIPNRLAMLSLCAGGTGFANGLRIGCTAGDRCFFMVIYLTEVLNVAFAMTP